MYIHRDIEPLLKRVAGTFPAVLLSGPRQSGKTTLLRTLFPEAHYVSFDDPLLQEFAERDPVGLLARHAGRPVILDEIQYVPQLFSRLKMAIDDDRHAYGRWLLTGSQQFAMLSTASESLAGRVALVDLLPFSAAESLAAGAAGLETLLWNGGYPEPAVRPEIRDTWLASYIRTYLERDVRQVLQVQDLGTFRTFLSLCAARHAQELNIASLARDCGIAQLTARRWISILQASFIVTTLPPFHANLGKRLIKTPKLYFIDPAIAAWLTRQAGPASLLEASMGGSFFEGFLVVETRKALANRGLNAGLSFWRSHDGVEIDLVIESGGCLHAIEFKKTATPTMRHADSLEKFRTLAGERVMTTLVVCCVAKEQPLSRHVTAVPWQQYLEWLSQLT